MQGADGGWHGPVVLLAPTLSAVSLAPYGKELVDRNRLLKVSIVHNGATYPTNSRCQIPLTAINLTRQVSCTIVIFVFALKAPGTTAGQEHAMAIVISRYLPRIDQQSQLYERGWVSLACFGKLWRARSRLCRSQIVQVNMLWKALAEICTMHPFAPL